MITRQVRYDVQVGRS